APRPYMEVVGPFLEDGVNAILYETEFSDGRYHLINRQELIAKIRDYLVCPEELERLAQAWAHDVREGHTVTARARYIVQHIEQALR
ncbi:MAG: glycosyltransferase, partial [Candidatus Sungiibacteriota bacterium]